MEMSLRKKVRSNHLLIRGPHRLEPGVQGMDSDATSDFSLTTSGLTGSSVASVSASGTTFVINGATYAVSYVVTVNAGTGSSGTVQMNLNDSKGTIHDSSNKLVENQKRLLLKP